jgi:hypothetical protein
MKKTSTGQKPDRQHKTNGISVCPQTGNTSYIVCVRARLCPRVLKIWHNLSFLVRIKTKKMVLIKNVTNVNRKNNLKILQQMDFTITS